MSDTQSVEIDDTGWTPISEGFAKGFISLSGDEEIFFRQSETVIANTVKNGHPLMPAQDSVNFEISGSEVIYGRAAQGAVTVFITQTPSS